MFLCIFASLSGSFMSLVISLSLLTFIVIVSLFTWFCIRSKNDKCKCFISLKSKYSLFGLTRFSNLICREDPGVIGYDVGKTKQLQHLNAGQILERACGRICLCLRQGLVIGVVKIKVFFFKSKIDSFFFQHRLKMK